MSLVKKKDWYLDYLLIIVGTGLMALASNSVFDATGLVTGEMCIRDRCKDRA